MTLKVETVRIPDTNSNCIVSYEEYKNDFNGQIQRNNMRKFVVPANKTDEFVKRYKKTEKISFKTMMLTGLAGFLTVGGIAFRKCYKHGKPACLDIPILAAIAGGVAGIIIPSLTARLCEKKLLADCNAEEIKNRQ